MVSVPTSQNFHCGVLVAEASVEASMCCYSFELTVYLLKNYLFCFCCFSCCIVLEILNSLSHIDIKNRLLDSVGEGKGGMI